MESSSSQVLFSLGHLAAFLEAKIRKSCLVVQSNNVTEGEHILEARKPPERSEFKDSRPVWQSKKRIHYYPSSSVSSCSLERLFILSAVHWNNWESSIIMMVFGHELTKVILCAVIVTLVGKRREKKAKNVVGGVTNHT